MVIFDVISAVSLASSLGGLSGSGLCLLLLRVARS